MDQRKGKATMKQAVRVNAQREVIVQTLKEKGSSNRQTAGRNGE